MTSEAALVAAALADDRPRVDALLDQRPELATDSFACALVLGSPDALPHAPDANAPVGPNAWPPLLYLCHSRYRGDDPERTANRLQVAQGLLRSGADPNAGTREMDSVRGYRTALGAAIGHARHPALAKALLDAGADVADGPTLYEGSAMWEAVRHRDIESLEALLAKTPPQWHVCHALPQALEYDDEALTRLLLDHDGDPNWTMGPWGFGGNCLHEAAVLGNSLGVVAALLEHGAKVDFRDRDGRTPLGVATCLNRHGIARLLLDHGAKEDGIRDVERWIGACFAGNEDEATRRRRISHNLFASDHLWLCRAIRTGNDEAVPLLLAGGLAADAMDDDGERALHLATVRSPFATQCLLAAGADTSLRNFAGRTPLDLARPHQEAAARLLAQAGAPTTPALGADFQETFERAADAVVAGDLPTLRRLFRGHPALAAARSPRPHRCTLLHYLGANGFETERQRTPANAVAVIDFLVGAGCDANAVCFTYRGGPEETTLGLLTSSDHPRNAGLTLAMVEALARGGANLNPVYRLLVALKDGVPAAFDPAARPAPDALVEAAILAETEIVFRLIDAGVDINAARPDGSTALHQAAISGNVGLVEKLLASGADLSRRDSVFDGTPAGWAYAGGHEELGKQLAARLRGASEGEL